MAARERSSTAVEELPRRRLPAHRPGLVRSVDPEIGRKDLPGFGDRGTIRYHHEVSERDREKDETRDVHSFSDPCWIASIFFDPGTSGSPSSCLGAVKNRR